MSIAETSVHPGPLQSLLRNRKLKQARLDFPIVEIPNYRVVAVEGDYAVVMTGSYKAPQTHQHLANLGRGRFVKKQSFVAICESEEAAIGQTPAAIAEAALEYAKDNRLDVSMLQHLNTALLSAICSAVGAAEATQSSLVGTQ